jgi:hypothetical protein
MHKNLLKGEAYLTAVRSTMSEERLDALIMLESDRNLLPSTDKMLTDISALIDGWTWNWNEWILVK